MWLRTRNDFLSDFVPSRPQHPPLDPEVQISLPDIVPDVPDHGEGAETDGEEPHLGGKWPFTGGEHANHKGIFVDGRMSPFRSSRAFECSFLIDLSEVDEQANIYRM